MRRALPVAFAALLSCGPEKMVEEEPPPVTGCGTECATQSACGAIGQKVCDCGRCAPAGVTADNNGTEEVQTGFAKINFSITSAIRAQSPRTYKLWAFYPKNPDGAALTCAQVLTGEAPDQSKMNPVKDNPTRVPISNLCGSCAISGLTGTLPAGVALVFYAEIYADPNGNPPRAGRGCTEGNTIDPGETGNNHTFGLDFH